MDRSTGSANRTLEDLWGAQRVTFTKDFCDSDRDERILGDEKNFLSSVRFSKHCGGRCVRRRPACEHRMLFQHRQKSRARAQR